MPTPSERQDSAHRAAESAFDQGFTVTEGTAADSNDPDTVERAVEGHRERIDTTNRETADAGTDM